MRSSRTGASPASCGLLLESVPGFEVIGEASTGEEAVRLAAEATPEVVLMDIGMPTMNGIEATRALLDVCPSARVVVLTMYEEAESVFAALRAGARGYLLEDAQSEDITRAIEAVACGDAIFGPAVAEGSHTTGVKHVGVDASMPGLRLPLLDCRCSHGTVRAFSTLRAPACP